MLHAPVNDKKTKPETSHSEVEQEPERLKSFSGWGDRAVQGQNGRLPATQQPYGNQAALRMMNGGVLQRKCACGNGNTGGSSESCTECQEKQEAVLQREVKGMDKWDKAYKTKRARPGNLTYEEYKSKIGQQEAEKYAPKLQAASNWGGTKLAPIALTRTELNDILKPEIPQDPTAARDHAKRLDDYLPQINHAFEVMEIDTVEAQADYLAHTAGESGMLKNLSESYAAKRPYAPFIGRGPVQVTWEQGYIQTLAYLETQAEKLADQATAKEQEKTQASDTHIVDPWIEQEAKQSRADAKLAQEAVAAIKSDITQAENPKYAFLFSAAFMHMASGVRKSASIGKQENFPGNENEDSWLTGRTKTFQETLDEAQKPENEKTSGGVINDMKSTISRAKVKQDTYAKAFTVLSKKAVNTETQRESDVVDPWSKQKGILQTKLRISEPGDRYEQEADRIANEVMLMPEPTIQNQVKSEKEGTVQRKAIANSITPLQSSSTGQDQVSEVPPIVNEVLRSPGNLLDSTTRAFFDLRFGYDFSRVRVHTDAKAAESAGTVNAQAYTVGKDIVFGSNLYNPHTEYGRYLLAHELSHVVQQSAAEQMNGVIQRQVGKASPFGSLPLTTSTSDGTNKGDLLAGYTQCDFLNEHISYEAQHALYQLYRQGERDDAVAMLAAVKSGEMQGIYKENEQKPALMAMHHQRSWWTLIPQGQKALVFDTEKPPMMMFKENISTDRVRLASALQSAWQSSALGEKPFIIPPPSGKPCPILLPEIQIVGEIPGEIPRPNPPTRCFDSLDWTTFFQQRTSFCESLEMANELTCSTLPPRIIIIPGIGCSKITNIPFSERVEECVVSEGFNLLVDKCGIPMQPPGKKEIRQQYQIWLNQKP